jgi:hypothetical protein
MTKPSKTGGVQIACTKTSKRLQLSSLRSGTMLKLLQEWGREDKGECGGVNSTMIHCKNFCKCHNVPPVQQ